jgi:hypothetical protein
MVTTRYTCDRCKQPAQDCRIRLVAASGVPVDLAPGRPTLELCAGCSEELAKWVAAMVPETALA